MVRSVLDMISVIHSLFVVLVLIGTVDSKGSADACYPEIRLRKNTILTASKRSLLRIPCNVTYCKEIPKVRWLILGDADKWTPIKETSQITVTHEQTDVKEVISYLSFKSISSQDSGIYRCVINLSNYSSQSHNINVSVSDNTLETPGDNRTIHSSTEGIHIDDWLPYIIICSAIFCLVTIVMLISFLSIHGCTCSKKVWKHRRKCAASSPVPPSPNISKNDKNVCGQEKPEQRNDIYKTSNETIQPETSSLHPGGDEENGAGSGPQQIIYATLEHLTPREPSVISLHSQDHFTEYASIRLN